MAPTRNNRGVAHENGAVESAHGHLKRRIIQQLQIHFPSITNQRYNFEAIEDFQDFIDRIVARHNRRNESLFQEELGYMSPLPQAKGVDYTEESVKVSSSSTVNIRRVVYSVPSRLIGERLCIHLYDDRLECHLGSSYVITLNRLHPQGGQRLRQIDYRHLIDSLARKPMAFYHADLRDDILPNERWQQLWQQCNQQLAPRQACYLIVGALEVAAIQDDESGVASALKTLLGQEAEPSLLTLQKCLGLENTRLPEEAKQDTQQHDLARYDQLLRQSGVGS